jgi:predicted dehydrogenase
MNQLAVGVIGAGGIARREHIPALDSHPDANVVAVCDPDESQLAAVVENWDIESTYESAEEMLADTDLDVVDICSPPQFHLEQAVLAFNGGHDVVMEKPMVGSIEDADELRRVQLDTGQKLTMIHNRKFRRSISRPLELVEEGEIGRVHTIDVNRFVDGDREEKIYDPNRWEHTLKGGRWAEILPHHIYQPFLFVDDLELLSVDGKAVNEEYKPYLIADEVSVQLAHSDGYVRIRYTANADEKTREMVIHGADGKIVTDAASTAKMRRFGSDWEDLMDGDDGSMSSHARELDRFIQYVRGDGPNPVSWEEAYTTMRIVDKISENLRSQYAHRDG